MLKLHSTSFKSKIKYDVHVFLLAIACFNMAFQIFKIQLILFSFGNLGNDVHCTSRCQFGFT